MRQETEITAGPTNGRGHRQLTKDADGITGQFGKQKSFLVIIDPRPLTRDCFASLFGAMTSEFAVLSVPSPQALLERRADLGGPVKLALLNIGARSLADPALRSDILFLREGFDACPTVLVGDILTAGQIRQAFELGVRGYLPTTLDATVAVEALRLICAGGSFAPANALVDALTAFEPAPKRDEGCEPAVRAEADCAQRLPSFTIRQLQVIGFLRKGQSNKVIAHELQMKESTVKVHIRHIMRKLNATNRTQAALLASGIDQPIN